MTLEVVGVVDAAPGSPGGVVVGVAAPGESIGVAVDGAIVLVAVAEGTVVALAVTDGTAVAFAV